MLDSILPTGATCSCSYEVWLHTVAALAEAEGQSMTLKARWDCTSHPPVTVKFGIDYDEHTYHHHDWEDFKRYRQVVCHELGVKFDGQWFITETPVNYGQLVFLTTLVRQPVELHDGFLYRPLYERMVALQLNPLEALAWSTYQTVYCVEEDEKEYHHSSSVYDNPSGHGVLGFVQNVMGLSLHRAEDNHSIDEFRGYPLKHIWKILGEEKDCLGDVARKRIEEMRVLPYHPYIVPKFKEPAL